MLQVVGLVFVVVWLLDVAAACIVSLLFWFCFRVAFPVGLWVYLVLVCSSAFALWRIFGWVGMFDSVDLRVCLMMWFDCVVFVC